ncbi:hypothetical protein BD410DRAFT_881866 [Rickenella mellea]|uniref:Aminoglycoside phosphotransferase domain-containing protein n=1 Tax=Rickenella mellea TaxID=50990 RepID=A0A4Y7QGD5_9AGAM|nr:hypothetical protein BD410DRAFT_881866 [Rickenella mellea]
MPSSERDCSSRSCSLEHAVFAFIPAWKSPSPFTPNCADQNIPARVDLLKKSFRVILDTDVTEIRYLGHGVFHVVYEVFLASAPPIVARISYNYKLDKLSLNWAHESLQSEAAVLEFLERNAAGVPIPKILHADPSPASVIEAPFMLMEKLNGRSSGYIGLPLKDMVTLPKIGQVKRLSASGEPIMGPIFDEREALPGGPFETIEDYVKYKLTSTLNAPRNTPPNPDNTLEPLFDVLSLLCSRLIPQSRTMLRIALSHGDLHDRNLLVEGSSVTGVIDWEAHSGLPACLAASYPEFLRQDGIRDKRYNPDDREDGMNPGRRIPSEDAAHLRDVFSKAAGEIDPHFAEALAVGERLRQLIEWLDFAEWNWPPLWTGCNLWVRDVSLELGLDIKGIEDCLANNQPFECAVSM